LLSHPPGVISQFDALASAKRSAQQPHSSRRCFATRAPVLTTLRLRDFSGRHVCRGCVRQLARGDVWLRSSKSFAIHSRTSDNHHPRTLPRNRALFGNRPISVNPTRSHRGRRVRRATSCALKSSVSGGYGSLIQRESTMGATGATFGSALPDRAESTRTRTSYVSNARAQARPIHTRKQGGELGAMRHKHHLPCRYRRSSREELSDTSAIDGRRWNKAAEPP
jgi:hypothetical protein